MSDFRTLPPRMPGESRPALPRPLGVLAGVAALAGVFVVSLRVSESSPVRRSAPLATKSGVVRSRIHAARGLGLVQFYPTSQMPSSEPEVGPPETLGVAPSAPPQGATPEPASEAPKPTSEGPARGADPLAPVRRLRVIP